MLLQQATHFSTLNGNNVQYKWCQTHELIWTALGLSLYHSSRVHLVGPSICASDVRNQRYVGFGQGASAMHQTLSYIHPCWGTDRSEPLAYQSDYAWSCQIKLHQHVCIVGTLMNHGMVNPRKIAIRDLEHV